MPQVCGNRRMSLPLWRIVLKRLLKTVVALALVPTSFSCFADDALIRKAVNAMFNTQNAVSEVTKLPYGDLHEVVLTDGQVLYMDGRGKYLIQGSLIDVEKRLDVTEKRESDRARLNFADLPLNQAIKQVRGNGKRVLVTFEDVNCGYCKKLAVDLKNLKDATIYTFMIPILAADSEVKARNIWCAADRAKAWNDWMVEGKEPPVAKCDDPIRKNLELANKYRIRGTPAIYLSDGTRAGGGYISLDKIDAALNRVEAAAKK
jgi:thiol:disulfide interchange protein DsbC